MKNKSLVNDTTTHTQPTINDVNSISACPRWDAQRQELWFGDTLVKHFHRPAPIAQLILTAFDEEGWPQCIDDPLPPIQGRRESKRLRNEVYVLNRRLQARAIRFTLNGTGSGICWEPV